MIFPEPLLTALRSSPGRPAFEYGERTVSRGEVLETVRRVASRMRGAGLGRRHGVAMLPALSPESFAANLAAHALGCRVVGVRPGWSTAQLAGVLSTQIDAVVVDPPLALEETEAVQGCEVLSLGACPGAYDLLGGGADAGRPVIAGARPDDIARLSFTSGSTGRPKGCAWTYRSYGLAYDPAHWAPEVARLLTRFERCLVFGSWSMPVMMTFAGRCLTTGGTVVIPAGEPPSALPYLIGRHRITATFATPPMLRAMLGAHREGPADLASLGALMLSGSPASPDLVAEAADLLGPVVWQGYGQAESGMISLLSPEERAARPAALASVGRPLPHVEVGVRDADGRPVKPGETGLIHVRSPQVMAGYWGDPHQTDEVLRDGWLDTRDLGYLGVDGFLYLTGRSREVILVNAEVRYAGPIERALAGHPDVDQAYAVGRPDEGTGEAIHAFLVLSGSRAPDEQALVGLVSAALGAGSVPKSFTVVPEVPLTPAGKPDKLALRWMVAPASRR